jgi:hypothetical protein
MVKSTSVSTASWRFDWNVAVPLGQRGNEAQEILLEGYSLDMEKYMKNDR